jgi:hypothetical protein
MSHDQENDGMCCEQVTLYDSQYERELIRDWKMIERRMEEVNIEIAKKKRELRQHRIKMWREKERELEIALGDEECTLYCDVNIGNIKRGVASGRVKEQATLTQLFCVDSSSLGNFDSTVQVYQDDMDNEEDEVSDDGEMSLEELGNEMNHYAVKRIDIDHSGMLPVGCWWSKIVSTERIDPGFQEYIDLAAALGRGKWVLNGKSLSFSELEALDYKRMLRNSSSTQVLEVLGRLTRQRKVWEEKKASWLKILDDKEEKCREKEAWARVVIKMKEDKKKEERDSRLQQLVDLFESNDVREGFGQGGLSTCQDGNVLCTKMGKIIVNPYVRKVGHKEVVVNNPYAKKKYIRRVNNCTSLDNSGTRISKTERNNEGGLDVGLKKLYIKKEKRIEKETDMSLNLVRLRDNGIGAFIPGFGIPEEWM